MSDDEEQPPKTDYEIGYCKPPPQHQFQPGHKRSPGRPPGSKNTKTLMLEAWCEKHPAVVKGKRIRVSRRQVATRRMAAKASDGDIKAFELFMKAEAEDAEHGGSRQAVSRFEEPADKLAMADIVRRIRNMPAEGLSSPEPQACDEQTSSDPNDLNPAGVRGASVATSTRDGPPQKPEGSP